MHMDLGMNSTLILDFMPCTKGTSRHLSDEPKNKIHLFKKLHDFKKNRDL